MAGNSTSTIEVHGRAQVLKCFRHLCRSSVVGWPMPPNLRSSVWRPVRYLIPFSSMSHAAE
eukprot:9672264-Lingulodinium_polyedra.AAC.1